MSATRRERLRAAAARLNAAGVEAGEDDAQRLAMKAWGLTRAALIAEPDAAAPATSAFEDLVRRRVNREPLSHILGTQPFWTLELEVGPDVLTPRADTETIVEEALAGVTDRGAPLRILDIATGSGAIVLALLDSLPNAVGVATELSAPALARAQRNARRCGLADRALFVRGFWARALSGRFDRVVSNPPYIASAIIDTLEPEVRAYEPRLALDGGADGLAAYRELFAASIALLAPGGRAVFEIGHDQGEAALALARQAGAPHARLARDLAGRDRAVVFEAGESGQ